ncbi:fasciclin domain-containing protein [Sarocladium implicatum]|nr:fasciclin domain-containing protein [Sarocladium implicatum]
MPGISGNSPPHWPSFPAATSRDIVILEAENDKILEQFAGKPPSSTSLDQSESTKLTAYEWLRQNPETSFLSDRLEEAPSVRDLLKDETSQCTIWAPTNVSWAEFKAENVDIEAVLQHHVSPHNMPLTRILDTPNIPTLLWPATLNGPLPLRARPQNGKLVMDGHAAITRFDIPVKNGTVHLVDSILIVPPPVSQLVALLPEEQFSHIRAFLQKSDFLLKLESSLRKGGTLFLPTDEAFQHIGQEDPSFWSSAEGVRFLQALLSYHTIPGETLYSNMFYHGENKAGVTSPPIQRATPESIAARDAPAKSQPAGAAASNNGPTPGPQKPSGKPKVLKGKRRFPLPTLLSEQWVNVEVSRCGGVISMFVEEGDASVVTQDVMTLNGVVHAVDRFMIPPSSQETVEAEDGAESKVAGFDRLKQSLDQYLQ